MSSVTCTRNESYFTFHSSIVGRRLLLGNGLLLLLFLELFSSSSGSEINSGNAAIDVQLIVTVSVSLICSQIVEGQNICVGCLVHLCISSLEVTGNFWYKNYLSNSGRNQTMLMLRIEIYYFRDELIHHLLWAGTDFSNTCIWYYSASLFSNIAFLADCNKMSVTGIVLNCDGKRWMISNSTHKSCKEKMCILCFIILRLSNYNLFFFFFSWFDFWACLILD